MQRHGPAAARDALREGAEVRKGGLLFVIGPRPHETDLERAEAALARACAQADLGRAPRARAEH
jgi:multidrug resistance efflux pump